jgi:hypothetical protein
MQSNATNAIHEWLKQSCKNIYLWESSWFVVTNILPSDLRDQLLPFINKEDDLLIFAVGPEWSAWGLKEKINNWLKDNWHPGLPLAT